VIQEANIQGVSTRSVDDLVKHRDDPCTATAHHDEAAAGRAGLSNTWKGVALRQ
jgi:hypothetical protein